MTFESTKYAKDYTFFVESEEDGYVFCLSCQRNIKKVSKSSHTRSKNHFNNCENFVESAEEVQTEMNSELKDIPEYEEVESKHDVPIEPVVEEQKTKRKYTKKNKTKNTE